MTAALILDTRERTGAPRVVTVRQEPDIIVRAREGDEASLAEIFDTVVTEVYGFAFGYTHKTREAERITDDVIARLPDVSAGRASAPSRPSSCRRLALK
ncbi:MAG TPA: hypothetical protein VJB57_20325 [Dehalococcoidia bacterium]|nr:hypothetical protein [Dehalococcoidia bacterium]